MITAWRLCRAGFADLSGEGARRFGGRWNSPGRPAVYLADHPALAILEVRVHLDLPLDELPTDYALLKIRLPPGTHAELDSLSADPRAAGDAWLRGATAAILRVPSALAPEAWNYLLNPAHATARKAAIEALLPFGFDRRLWNS